MSIWQMRTLTGDDFDDARAVADAWFGHPVGLTMHRLFFDQLGTTGLRLAHIDTPEVLVGVLLGFASQADPALAYIHFVMVDPEVRGTGAASTLYREFGRRMADRGCRRVRSLAGPARTASIAFHESLGFIGTFAPEYLGPDQDRIIFERPLPFSAVT